MVFDYDVLLHKDLEANSIGLKHFFVAMADASVHAWIFWPLGVRFRLEAGTEYMKKAGPRNGSIMFELSAARATTSLDGL